MTISGAGKMEFVAFDEARELVLRNVPVLGACEIEAAESSGYVTAESVFAKVSSPSVDTSLMDGFAVSSAATSGVSEEKPLRLRIAMEIAAGGQGDRLAKGECARIFTGAPVPDGADAVIPVEECAEEDGGIVVSSPVNPGSHVQPAGENFGKGDAILEKGTPITPGGVGLLVSAGVRRVAAISKPRAGILAVGDELAEEGTKLEGRKVYASNHLVLQAWLSRFGVGSKAGTVRDDAGEIARWFKKAVESSDAVITTGGVGGSLRDLVPGALDSLGWQRVFYGVKMRPGKGTAFGLLHGKPVFCLPGGPTSCEIAFLSLALPGLLRMAGWSRGPFHIVAATLSDSLKAAAPGWTRFVFGVHAAGPDGAFLVTPLLGRSRLRSAALATCLVAVRSDTPGLGKGQTVQIQPLAL